MTIIQEKDRLQIQNHLVQLANSVKIINFTQESECMYCRETRQLLEELASLSDKLSFKVYDFVADKAIAAKYGIEKIPATVIEGEKDYGVRFYGIPSGYEFTTLLDALVMVSKKQSGVSEQTRRKVAEIKSPVHLQVFVTPTCPFCPQAVHLAHKLAMESDLIVADMVEATEFPHLSQRYGVMGVPKTIANDSAIAEGALPEELLVDKMLSIVSSKAVA